MFLLGDRSGAGLLLSLGVYCDACAMTPGTFADRFKLALGDERALPFSKRANLPNSSVQNYLSGKEPGRENLVLLADALNVTVEWLAAGRGEMRPGKAADLVDSEEARSGELVAVPFVMASASAGPGLVPVSEGVANELFSSGFLRRYGLFPRTTAALEVQGDSMLRQDGTGIPSGALALINTAIGDEDVVTGCIYVLVRGDELLIKRVERHIDGTITLHPDNNRYKSEHVSSEMMQSIHIVGRLKVAVLEV